MTTSLSDLIDAAALAAERSDHVVNACRDHVAAMRTGDAEAIIESRRELDREVAHALATVRVGLHESALHAIRVVRETGRAAQCAARHHQRSRPR
jgi:hypothetical protein